MASAPDPPTPPSSPALAEVEALRRALADCLLADRTAMRRRLRALASRARRGEPIDRGLGAVRRRLEASIATRGVRATRAARPIEYPDALPIAARREEIASAIRAHQVVIVAGETGSGKTTQLPKICLELGRGVEGRIGHTQPRRVAARTVAQRIAEELGVAPGSTVGWQVRFTSELDDRTSIKLMTDGILLAETQRDPDLLAYDTIIVDEAHERSLNIDFLLGYLRRLLPRRPDLKVIVTSATIDSSRFSEHFADAPVIEVGGRLHPIEIRWRPLDAIEGDDPAEALADEDTPTLQEAITSAVEECIAIERQRADDDMPGVGDILVFLSGEREIHETATHLNGAFSDACEVLPLYARLPASAQQKVFTRPDDGARRIVLATNVAETSVTVPRVRFVIDPGLARVSRYAPRSRMQRLPIERISRASATQRAGRCGRLGPGVCIRLYGQTDFDERAEFTEPEILRSNLAGVILRMLSLRLGRVEDFPFVEPPPTRMIEEGWATLHELGAIERGRALTKIGRRLARLPVDPMIGRMILAGIDEHCPAPVVTIAAALSVPDPRERPSGGEAAADLAHAAWRDERSDFLSLLRLWRDWCARREELGSSALRRWCRERSLSFLRMREWADLRAQLADLLREQEEIAVGPGTDEPDSGAFHRSLLTGLVHVVGQRDEQRTYRGPRGLRFSIHPSSVLFRQTAPWIMAAEIVETTKPWARPCARIRGDWIERVAPHLVERTHAEPHYLRDAGQVAAWETVRYGELVIVDRRRVPYAPIDAEGARQLFIEAALVDERLRTRAPFLAKNRALRERLEEQEARARRRDLLVDGEARFAFYDARIPAGIHNAPSFEHWRRNAERDDPDVLVMRERDLLRPGAARADADRFPDRLEVAGLTLPLLYRHEPGSEQDGVAVQVPVEALGGLDAARLVWLVPGLLEEKIDALVRTIPKRLRTRLQPLAETVAGACEGLAFGEGDLLVELAKHLSTIAGTVVRAEDFDAARLPDHLRMRIDVLDRDDETIGSGRELEALRERFEEIAGASFDAVVAEVEHAAIEPERLVAPPTIAPEESVVIDGRSGLRGYPALTLTPDHRADARGRDAEPMTAIVRVHEDAASACVAQRTAIVALLADRLAAEIEPALAWVVDLDALAAHDLALRGTIGSIVVPWRASVEEGTGVPGDDARPTLHRRLLETIASVAAFGGRPAEAARVRDAAAFDAAAEGAFGRIARASERVATVFETICHDALGLASALDESAPRAWSESIEDIEARLADLLRPVFDPEPAAVDWREIAATPQRIAGLVARHDRLRDRGPARDVAGIRALLPWRERTARLESLARAARLPGSIDAFEWRALVEAYELGTFAPTLTADRASSGPRLERAWESIRAAARER